MIFKIWMYRNLIGMCKILIFKIFMYLVDYYDNLRFKNELILGVGWFSNVRVFSWGIVYGWFFFFF